MGIESFRGLAMCRSVTQLGEQYVSWDARLAPPVPAQGGPFLPKTAHLDRALPRPLQRPFEDR